MNPENQEKTEVVDVDIKALIRQAKENNPLEPKKEEKTVEELLERISLTPNEPVIPKAEEKTEVAPTAVEEPEVKKEKPKKEPAVDKLDKIVSNNYNNKIKQLIEDGLIEDVAIGVNDGDTTKEVFLSELEISSEADYKEILNSYKAAKDNELKEKYISVDGLDETTKKLIELKKAGGDISQLIQEDVQFIDTLERMKNNIDDEQQQINIVYHDLKNKGLSEKVIKAQIEDLMDNADLDKVASDILNREIDKYEQSIEDKRQAQLKIIDEEKERQKEFKKEITSKVKDFKLDESLQKILIQNSTVRDQNGLTNTDKLYFDSINDPEKHAKIAFMLHNYEEFENLISQKKVLDKDKRITKTLFTANLNTTKKATTSNGSDKVNSLVDRLKV
jgi:hypothetical protein